MNGLLKTDGHHDFWGVKFSNIKNSLGYVVDDSANKDAILELESRDGAYHVGVITGSTGTGYVDGNTIKVDLGTGTGGADTGTAANDIVLAFTDGNADGKIQTGELVVTSGTPFKNRGPASWTSGM